MNELETLKDILRQALADLDGLHPPGCDAADQVELREDGEYEIVPSDRPCSCFVDRALEAIRPSKSTEAPIQYQGTSRMDGEECGHCGDSSTFHSASGKGLCTRANCDCFKFVPTGRPNTKAR